MLARAGISYRSVDSRNGVAVLDHDRGRVGLGGKFRSRSGSFAFRRQSSGQVEPVQPVSVSGVDRVLEVLTVDVELDDVELDELVLDELMYVMPSTPLIACSSGVVTADSTACAFAPV